MGVYDSNPASYGFDDKEISSHLECSEELYMLITQPPLSGQKHKKLLPVLDAMRSPAGCSRRWQFFPIGKEKAAIRGNKKKGLTNLLFFEPKYHNMSIL